MGARMVEDCFKLSWNAGFFRKLRADSCVLIIQCSANLRGRFLQLYEFGNRNKRGILVVPEGWNGKGWEGFVYNIHKTEGSKAPIFSYENRVNVVHPKSSLDRRGGRVIGGSSVLDGTFPPKGVLYVVALGKSVSFSVGRTLKGVVDGHRKERKAIVEKLLIARWNLYMLTNVNTR